ncbi:transposase [Listeria newyorkensis]|uniref:Transposase n=1 Tax=Listeria newyorkensis TaxID=1497681 RepID=A0A841YYJ7_9LIST|nr:transposase [Listeria newyorkensis]MBC1458971.1 transposase [Listeria newyorkensis]
MRVHKPFPRLPKMIAIDKFKGDTDKGKFQLIIADPLTRRPIDILENHRAKTIQRYLRERGQQVEIVIMDLSQTFKRAVQQALEKPVIIADSFHFSRYIYWALNKVRVRVQQHFSEQDRKHGKRIQKLLFKRSHKLDTAQKSIIRHYSRLHLDLQTAYTIKEAYQAWFDTNKAQERRYPHLSNGFVEGINNRTKVIKRTSYGYRDFSRFRAKILAPHFIKDFNISVG